MHQDNYSIESNSNCQCEAKLELSPHISNWQLKGQVGKGPSLFKSK